ncbi:MAG: zf-HC2 domain-containing protein [Thermogemmatispora sp.]|uniref:anti-sigma factor family protein n=1 Tax=Thermogemmatispora sp. TaxID=1968838 RepID=UPI0019E6AFF2|nr:zf-HC2 domain-containing protein [Thermogemmatispora sp.]MBE3564825.1 zf-HC2 domain-containing protein [Thermogemmatispora sp.]
MNCDELRSLLPELVDGSLSPAQQAEARAALAVCPECRREFEVARQVHAFFQVLRQREGTVPLSVNLERRVLARLHQERCSLELLDLSAPALTTWLRELLHMLGAFLVPDWERNEGSASVQVEPGP